MGPRVEPGGDTGVWGSVREKNQRYCAASLVSTASLRRASGCGMAMML
jgi:hypothetical protein